MLVYGNSSNSCIFLFCYIKFLFCHYFFLKIFFKDTKISKLSQNWLEKDKKKMHKESFFAEMNKQALALDCSPP